MCCKVYQETIVKITEKKFRFKIVICVLSSQKLFLALAPFLQSWTWGTMGLKLSESVRLFFVYWKVGY